MKATRVYNDIDIRNLIYTLPAQPLYVSVEELSSILIDRVERIIANRLKKITTINELQLFAEMISTDTVYLKVSSLDGHDQKNYVELVLDELINTRVIEGESFEHRVKELFIAQLELVNNVTGTPAKSILYSSKNKTIRKNQHMRSWEIANTPGMKSVLVANMVKVFSNVLLTNTAMDYVKEFPERFLEMRFKKLVELNKQDNYKKPLNDRQFKIPTHKPSKNYFLNLIHQKKLLPEEIKIISTRKFDSFGQSTMLDWNGKYLKNFNQDIVHSILAAIVFNAKCKETSQYKARRKTGINTTKKTINKKTQELMENNLFLDIFGFVELDNAVKETDFKNYEADFIKLCKIIPLPNCKDIIFRIRKMGQRNLKGAYYYSPKAIVVDINSVNTFCHELGHLLDCELAEQNPEKINFLSKEKDFLEIHEIYTHEVIEILEASEDIELREMENYFIKHQECFARSFELYLKELGVNLALNDIQHKEPIYNVSEMLINKIMQYFNDLFGVSNQL